MPWRIKNYVAAFEYSERRSALNCRKNRQPQQLHLTIGGQEFPPRMSLKSEGFSFGIPKKNSLRTRVGVILWMKGYIHPGKLTWQWKTNYLKMDLLLTIVIFQWLASFRGMSKNKISHLHNWMSGRLPLRCFQSMFIQLWAIQVSTPDYYLVHGGKFKWLTSGLDQFPETPDTFLGQTTTNTKRATIKTLINSNSGILTSWLIDYIESL